MTTSAIVEQLMGSLRQSVAADGKATKLAEPLDISSHKVALEAVEVAVEQVLQETSMSVSYQSTLAKFLLQEGALVDAFDAATFAAQEAAQAMMHPAKKSLIEKAARGGAERGSAAAASAAASKRSEEDSQLLHAALLETIQLLAEEDLIDLMDVGPVAEGEAQTTIAQPAKAEAVDLQSQASVKVLAERDPLSMLPGRSMAGTSVTTRRVGIQSPQSAPPPGLMAPNIDPAISSLQTYDSLPDMFGSRTMNLPTLENLPDQELLFGSMSKQSNLGGHRLDTRSLSALNTNVGLRTFSQPDLNALQTYDSLPDMNAFGGVPAWMTADTLPDLSGGASSLYS